MMSPTASCRSPTGTVSTPGSVPGTDWAPTLASSGIERQELGPERDPLTERDEIALGVAVDHPPLRIPPERGRLALTRTRALQHGTDQDRPIRHLGGGLHRLPGRGVEQRVDVGGVLGPQDEVGLRDLPQPGLDRQVDGLGEVVVGHRPSPPQRLDAAPRHVALHDADVHRRLASPPDQTPAAGRGEAPGPSGPAPGRWRPGRSAPGTARVAPRLSRTTPYAIELGDQRDQEGDTGHAHDRIEAGQRCVDRRERQLPPAEPAERDPRVRELDQRPSSTPRPAATTAAPTPG